MPHDPKIEVFTFFLKSTTTNTPNTFQSFLTQAFPSTKQSINYETLYKKFFKLLLNKIKDAYSKDDKRKKAITTKPLKRGQTLNLTIAPNFKEKIISGTVKGGKYGSDREIGNMTLPKNDNEKLSKEKIVLDDFYFLLYTPLGSSKCLLILQSYSDDSINDVFISYLRNLLKTEAFYKPTVGKKCPDVIQKEFKKHSIVKELRYTQNIVIDDVEDSDSIQTKEVIVEIKITAKDKGEKISKLNNLSKVLGRMSFKPNKKDILLEDFNKKMGTLKNNTQLSSFELDADLEIRPALYLKNVMEVSDEGLDWTQLDKYCKDKLLVELKKEVYPEKNGTKN